MRVTIEAFPPYREALGGRHIELEMAEGSTLRDVLRELARRSAEFDEYARARGDEWLWGRVIVHVRGEMVLLDEALRDGDHLELLPPIAGGAPTSAQCSVLRAQGSGEGKPY